MHSLLNLGPNNDFVPEFLLEQHNTMSVEYFESRNFLLLGLKMSKESTNKQDIEIGQFPIYPIKKAMYQVYKN